MPADSYYLIGDRAAITASNGTAVRGPRKFRHAGIGLTRSGAEVELRHAKQELSQFRDNPRIAARMAVKIAALQALLEPEQTEDDIRREISIEHRRLEAEGGDPSRHKQLIGKLRERKTR